jgi:hypothetical protein
MQGRKKILIVSEAHLIKRFVEATVNKIKEETGTQFDCFITTPVDEKTRQSLAAVFENVFINEYPRGVIKKVPKLRIIQAIYGLRRVAGRIPNYDIVHIHFHHFYFSFFMPIIRKKAKKVFLTFYGGDFHELNNVRHWFNQKSVNLLDGVFAENEVMLEDIANRYKIDRRKTNVGVLIFLMDNFISFEPFLRNNSSDSAKEIWNIKKGVIVCAYSAGIVMRHDVIIDAANLIKSKLPDYKMIFPMTYGNRREQTIPMVKEKLKTSLFDSLVLEEFLTKEKLQALRLAADIFINIPSRDQMASSMLEHLAAGSVVITGRWLPYDRLSEMGIYFISIETPDNLPVVLSDVLDNLEYHKNKSKVNRDIILDMMSWDSIKKNWYKYYELDKNA